MREPKVLSLLVAVLIATGAAFNEARAAEASPALVPAEAAPQVPMPGEARIAADLEGHSLMPGAAVLSGNKGFGDKADSTAIRSSVRHGEVLEYTVTSIYYADSAGASQREVDSTVRYQKSGDNWQLLGVQIEGAREVAAGNPGITTDC
jgi:hypothetical protein